MHPSNIVLFASLALTATARAQDTLLFFPRYDSTSIDDKFGVGSQLRPFDLSAVTPGAAATAHTWVASAGIAAAIGDADNDGRFAEFQGLPQASWGLGAPFVKWADKKTGDPRLVYWSIREPIANAPKITLFDGNKTHVVRIGDWVRVDGRGNAEFFIKREHIVDAMGVQKGNWVEGATCICQAPNGDLYYTPAHGPSKNGGVAGGHWVSNGQIQVFAYDGAICYIAAKDITYDAKGNVTAIKKGAARLIVNEIGGGPNGEPDIRDMTKNSGAVDGRGQKTLTTFMMVGIDIDPNGGTFTGWYDKTIKHPNLLFTFENTDSTCCGGLGSWHGTIFTTAGRPMGQIAKINGTSMGVTTGKADGKWLGLKTDAAVVSEPIARGLAVIQNTQKSIAPYGVGVLQIGNDGLVDIQKDPNLRFAAQGVAAALPSVLFVGGGLTKGGRPNALDASAFLGGFASLYVNQGGGPIQLVSGGVNPKAQAQFTFGVPNNPSFVGQSLLWQTYSFSAKGGFLSNPVISEFR